MQLNFRIPLHSKCVHSRGGIRSPTSLSSRRCMLSEDDGRQTGQSQRQPRRSQHPLEVGTTQGSNFRRRYKSSTDKSASSLSLASSFFSRVPSHQVCCYVWSLKRVPAGVRYFALIAVSPVCAKQLQLETTRGPLRPQQNYGTLYYH